MSNLRAKVRQVYGLCRGDYPAHSERAKALDEMLAECEQEEKEEDILPTPEELMEWDDGRRCAAVRSYRHRLNCGLREAVDAFKNTGRKL
jgi:hypothetical protein